MIIDDDYKKILEIYCDCLSTLDTPRQNVPIPHVGEWLHISWWGPSSYFGVETRATVFCSKSGDIVGRAGGFEFALPQMPLRNILLSARSLSRALRGSPYATEMTEKYAELEIGSPEFEAHLTEARLC